MRPIVYAHLIIFLGVLSLKHYYVYTTFGELTLCNFQINELTDRSKTVLLLWIIMFFLSFDALWSSAEKGLTSWLSFVMSHCDVVTFPLVSWVRCGA